jgi:flavodoxin
MPVLVVYESMFGNTHTVADRIAEGLGPLGEVTVVAVSGATPEVVAGADLVVVGGPTHIHGMVRPTSQKSAVEQAATNDDLDLDPDAEGPGLREWFEGLGDGAATAAAAFDTRVGSVSGVVSGRASKGIARRLARHGFAMVADPESFLVDKHNLLMDGEADRARAWGATLAGLVAPRRA